MAENLFLEDYITLGVYFCIVLAVGLWSTFRPNKGNAKGYFLAGKDMHWIPIGASIYASNIGAPMFIGLAGTAAGSGIAVTIYEWHAVFFLILLGWVFLPVYVACGAYTIPEWVKKRFGGRRLRMYVSFLALLGYILFNVSGEIYTGAIFLQQMLEWNIYLCVSIILGITALYTTVGGLASVIYTDTLQTVVLIIGATILFFMSIIEVGGYEAMETKFMNAISNETRYNRSHYSCGVPPADSLHIFRDAVTGDIPWPGALLGLSTLGLYTWDQDQIIVQRTLSARNMVHAKAGALLGAALKLTGFLMFVIPGMNSRILYTEEVACSDPDKCMAFCNNKSGCTNIAYPLMVLRLLPKGLRGLMLAALLAALMSSLTSILNSASSIMTLDIWHQFRKKASQSELMIVGRVTVLVLIALSILWLPILQQTQGGRFWFYMQSVKSYLIPPLCMMFLLGLFWKRTTEQGVFWGLMLSIVVGFVRMVLDFTFLAPACGSNEVDPRPEIISKVDFLHFATLLALFSTIAMVVISLFTQPRPEKKLHRLTWWTKDDEEEPELTDDEDEEVHISVHVKGEDSKTMQIQESDPAAENEEGGFQRLKTKCRNWVCGIDEDAKQNMTAQELQALRRKMTSLEEDSKLKTILNASAISISLVTVFLLGYFH
ncbi:sodium/glucose cotransporter 4-like isoform X2 [Crassostrea angulata]|uniref:sodium/glucose cotransporter 4-like isoform X2 n=1 Tax=Magallana angulata TaxID=2784310 RepID=UPI0022B0A42E|nr:sodium/glucose cotransporter 4-like isoform X2 [Crassostrea angulata]